MQIDWYQKTIGDLIEKDFDFFRLIFMVEQKDSFADQCYRRFKQPIAKGDGSIFKNGSVDRLSNTLQFARKTIKGFHAGSTVRSLVVGIFQPVMKTLIQLRKTAGIASGQKLPS